MIFIILIVCIYSIDFKTCIKTNVIRAKVVVVTYDGAFGGDGFGKETMLQKPNSGMNVESNNVSTFE